MDTDPYNRAMPRKLIGQGMFGDTYPTCSTTCQDQKDCDDCPIQEAFARLRQYEQTGLTPGQIRELKLQPQFTIQEAFTTPEGRRVRAIRYQADFSYERPTAPDVTGEIHWLKVVEDVKSCATKTRVYEIKKKLLQEKFGIEIREV